jgi:hypothetical protein
MISSAQLVADTRKVAAQGEVEKVRKIEAARKKKLDEEKAARKKKLEEEKAVRKKKLEEEAAAAAKKAEEQAKAVAAKREKAEQDAKRKAAEQEARQKAEEEARQKAEEEAKRKEAEEEAKKKEEEEAKAVEAKRKEEETKNKEEEEAKKKEEEAKRKAREEANIKDRQKIYNEAGLRFIKRSSVESTTYEIYKKALGDFDKDSEYTNISNEKEMNKSFNYLIYKKKEDNILIKPIKKYYTLIDILTKIYDSHDTIIIVSKDKDTEQETNNILYQYKDYNKINLIFIYNDNDNNNDDIDKLIDTENNYEQTINQEDYTKIKNY